VVEFKSLRAAIPFFETFFTSSSPFPLPRPMFLTRGLSAPAPREEQSWPEHAPGVAASGRNTRRSIPLKRFGRAALPSQSSNLRAGGPRLVSFFDPFADGDAASPSESKQLSSRGFSRKTASSRPKSFSSEQPPSSYVSEIYGRLVARILNVMKLDPLTSLYAPSSCTLPQTGHVPEPASPTSLLATFPSPLDHPRRAS